MNGTSPHDPYDQLCLAAKLLSTTRNIEYHERQQWWALGAWLDEHQGTDSPSSHAYHLLRKNHAHYGPEELEWLSDLFVTLAERLRPHLAPHPPDQP